ncbi:putative disease resistance protein RXW24L [Silene latifolia]|uniref:putative disease resistance protein RXW24L n=1 Tax=Silene latifolia TaxID=37657 RepID=UPI003D77F9CE
MEMKGGIFYSIIQIQNTVETVRAVLEDADARKDSLNSQEKNYVKDLKDAVYDADDVLDEFLTLAKQEKLRGDGDKFTDKERYELLTSSSARCRHIRN